MAMKFYKLSLNKPAYDRFLQIKKRYYDRHNLKNTASVTESDIFIDLCDFVLSD